MLVASLALPALQGPMSRMGYRGNSISIRMAAPDGFVPPPPKEGDYVDIFCRAVSMNAARVELGASDLQHQTLTSLVMPLLDLS